VIPEENITGGATPGKYDVVYVATESDSVYAIDAQSGKVLIRNQINQPVPLNQWPPPSPTPPAYSCGNNGPNVGINSTPVIDRANNTMYVVAYSWEGGNTVFRLHALNLSDLSDRLPAVAISGTHALTNGTAFSFNPGWQRQRPALLLNSGTLYVAFGSFCDWGGPSPSGLFTRMGVGLADSIAYGPSRQSAEQSADCRRISGAHVFVVNLDVGVRPCRRWRREHLFCHWQFGFEPGGELLHDVYRRQRFTGVCEHPEQRSASAA
jgi:outer membrane protein assembly factor BamB